jgi:hypothetical protein
MQLGKKLNMIDYIHMYNLYITPIDQSLWPTKTFEFQILTLLWKGKHVAICFVHKYNDTYCTLPPKLVMDLMHGLVLHNWNLEANGTIQIEGCELCGFSNSH